MIYLRILTLLTFLLLSYSCGAVKEGFSNQKKNNTDEFLVEKKSPLQMPPNFDELPVPNSSSDVMKNDNQAVKNLITKQENNNLDPSSTNKSFEKSLLEKIKSN